MAPVFEAKIPEKALTSSRKENDWYPYFDRSEVLTVDRLFQLPEFNTISSDVESWKWASQKTGTARLGETKYLREVNLIDEISSPLLPAKNKFHIKLTIRNIKKGRPSICDEIEL